MVSALELTSGEGQEESSILVQRMDTYSVDILFPDSPLLVLNVHWSRPCLCLQHVVR